LLEDIRERAGLDLADRRIFGGDAVLLLPQPVIC
jgi:hypothetical protein